MEILLNPNIAYLLLVAGIVMALLALLSPGTGLLEIGALFALLLAGWGVYNLPINPWALVVLLVGGLLFILAIRRSSQPVYLAVSILALLVGSAFLFRGQGWQPAVNPLLALVVSALSAGFFWVAARKALEAERMRPTHDLGTLIGAMGETKTAIGLGADTQEGTVLVAGELWSARSQKPIPADAAVRIIGREGFILEVEPANGQQPLT